MYYRNYKFSRGELLEAFSVLRYPSKSEGVVHTFENCSFEGLSVPYTLNYRGNFKGCNIRDVAFNGCEVQGSFLDCDFKDSKFGGVKFLRLTTFDKCKLKETKFEYCDGLDMVGFKNTDIFPSNLLNIMDPVELIRNYTERLGRGSAIHRPNYIGGVSYNKKSERNLSAISIGSLDTVWE